MAFGDRMLHMCSNLRFKFKYSFLLQQENTLGRTGSLEVCRQYDSVFFEEDGFMQKLCGAW